MDTVRIVIPLDQDLYSQLSKRAEDNHESIVDLVNHVVRVWLGDMEAQEDNDRYQSGGDISFTQPLPVDHYGGP